MGLEDPKDLRARFRKFLILTNERKKMSKTTLRKRISLVAVTALTAGVLSVVASPAANANIAAGTVTSQATYTVNRFNVAVIPSTTGAAIADGQVVGNNKSLGLIYKDASSQTAQTATMLATGALSLYTKAATVVAFVASGGAFSAADDGENANTSITVASSLRGVISADTTTDFAVVWTPGAVGTYTISAYQGNGAGTLPDSTLGLARGTLYGQITVTVVATGNAGTYSAVYSACNMTRTAAASGAAANAVADGVDTSGSTAIDNGLTGHMVFALRDAYGTLLSTGLPVIATATNGALVDIATTASAAVSSTDIDSTVAAATVSVAQSVANAPLTTTITLSYNGVVVCTETLTIRGEVASIKATNLRAQGNAGTTIATEPLNGVSGGTLAIETFDSAGNKVNPLAVGGTKATAAQFTTVASTVDTVVTGLTFDDAAVATGVASTDATGQWPLSKTQAYAVCATGKAGTNSALKITFQNPSGTIITSPAFSQRCAGNPHTYTASWDKASYNQGEIAKLTVSFKDLAGNAAASLTTGTTAVITAPMLTQVGSTANNTRADLNGAIVYTFTVGTTGTFTEGTYNSLVDFPTYTAVAASVATTTYKISTGTTSVSNADVLKSIVALIASINKQIRALQKLILKR
jgi:hypothetical protein